MYRFEPVLSILMLEQGNEMNVKNTKLSIVVPVYNTGQYLRRCLKSICTQTLKEIEIILVDDGSEDDSGEICDAHAAADARIQVIHKVNEGPGSARRAGLAFATGKYIGFVDSDDWIEPDMYQTLYGIAVCNDADIVAEGMIDDLGNESQRRLNMLPSGKYGTTEDRKKIYENMISCRNFFQMGIQPYLWNKLFRRELAFRYINMIPQSIRIGEDAAALYPMLVQADTIVISDTAHYHYCRRETSVMLEISQEDQEYENAVLLHSFLRKAFAETGMYEVMREQLWRYTVNNLMTRAYGKYAEMDKESVLFPFSDIAQDDSLIIYGAGAFGKAVYQYAVNHKNLKVEAWIDQKAAAYQELGLDVSMLEDVHIEHKHKIIVAVFSEAAYWKIREKLIKVGVALNQIKWIDTEKISNLLVIGRINSYVAGFL